MKRKVVMNFHKLLIGLRAWYFQTQDQIDQQSMAYLKNLSLYPEKHKNSYTILCDCKNAINYIKEIYKPPLKYTPTINKIQGTRIQLQNKNITTQLLWIPGHTNNKWNDLGDSLAKKAAKSWLSYPNHISGLACDVLSVQPPGVTD